MNVTPAPSGDIYVNDRILSSTLTTYDPKVIQLYFWYGSPHVPKACGVACTGFFNESKDGACAHLCWSGDDAYNLFDNGCGINDCSKITWNSVANQVRVVEQTGISSITINGNNIPLSMGFYTYSYSDESIEAQTVPIVINGCTTNIKKP